MASEWKLRDEKNQTKQTKKVVFSRELNVNTHGFTKFNNTTVY